ncbi:hypothetical protein [Actinomadura viridis]|uniref:Uncharacterized protein n=1 Tax=Actinomadura viridis TaxID=58110 RepID=A0A931DFU8_9ACTN|nr:hypothetical protein [Actinomadura viridis]MBG6087522.1 hypothetical protein [Actinomadura viridis]
MAIAVGAVVVIGAGAYALTGEDEAAGPRSEVAAATPAEHRFAADPAARADGLVQALTTVAAFGSTVVAAGTETAGDGSPGGERAQFLVSADAGRNWRLAGVRAPDGAAPAPGARPRLLAGGDGAWAAIGQTARPGEVALWTSVDARTWTRETAAGAPFGPNDRVNALVRTAGGFVAAGVTSPGGKFAGDVRAVVWTSAEGRAWRRADLGVPGVTGLDALAASGNTVLAHGTAARSVTKTVKRKGKKKGTRKVTSTVRGDGLWRSADGGRTWAPVNVPHAQGSAGPLKGPVAGPGGFYATRDGKTTTGPKKKRRTARHGVVFGSRDGVTWAPTGRFTVPGYGRVERLAGSSAGLAALVRGKGNAGTVLRSADGRTWLPSGGLGAPGPGSAVSGLAAAGGGAVLTGHRGDDGFMALAGSGAGPVAGPVAMVDLTKVPGAVRPERALTACAPGASGRVVFVGSTGGDAAAWSMAGPSSWVRGRSADFGAGRAGGPGQGRKRLNDVAHGPRGWLAVGRADAPKGAATPLVTASPDGTAWHKVTLPGGQAASGVASGPAGYVVVGVAGGKAAAWRSADLKGWTRGVNAGKGDLDGAAWMRDVASVAKGYVAVGGRRGAKPAAPAAGAGGAAAKPADLPAIWTSADGRAWTAVAPPALPAGIASGAFFQVVARGDALVALGWGSTTGATTTGAAGAPARPAAFAAHSADGGRTWRTDVPRGVSGAMTLTAATATSKGFLLAGTAGVPGRQDVVLWTSPDGAGWRRVAASGTGLDGPGDQRLTSLAGVGNEVVGTGVSADHRGETPMLWRTPAP